jgi:hypothetical protein
MTAHWIEVKEGTWKLRSEVVGFKPISGDHSGWNLGRYIVGLCERVGICTQDVSKVTYYGLFNKIYLLFFYLARHNYTRQYLK